MGQKFLLYYGARFIFVLERLYTCRTLPQYLTPTPSAPLFPQAKDISERGQPFTPPPHTLPPHPLPLPPLPVYFSLFSPVSLMCSEGCWCGGCLHSNNTRWSQRQCPLYRHITAVWVCCKTCDMLLFLCL